MGAENFCTEMRGENAKEAFKTAVEDACYDYGHAGYTGTIAEKGSYVMSKIPQSFIDEGKVYEWLEMVEEFDEENTKQEHFFLLKADHNIYQDKWGPALCFKCKDGKFIFTGYASS